MQPFRRREQEPESLNLPPHFQRAFRYESKFDWFCAGLVAALPFLAYGAVRSFF